MKTEYKIKKHGNKWSIDQYVNGQFVSQIAYWFKSPGTARRRLNEIIEEQKEKNNDQYKRPDLQNSRS